MNDNDRKSIERIIYYCNRLHDHVSFFGDSKEEFFNNKQYQDACFGYHTNRGVCWKVVR